MNPPDIFVSNHLPLEFLDRGEKSKGYFDNEDQLVLSSLSEIVDFLSLMLIIVDPKE